MPSNPTTLAALVSALEAAARELTAQGDVNDRSPNADLMERAARVLRAVDDVEEFEVSASGEFATWTTVLEKTITRALGGSDGE